MTLEEIASVGIMSDSMVEALRVRPHLAPPLTPRATDVAATYVMMGRQAHIDSRGVVWVR